MEKRSLPVCLYIGRSVCLSQSWALQKQMNRLRCRVGCGRGWAQRTPTCVMGVQITHAKGQFWRGKGRPIEHSAMSCEKTAEPIKMPFGMWTGVAQASIYQIGCILAPPGEYDSTVHLRRWWGLMSNYADHKQSDKTTDIEESTTDTEFLFIYILHMYNNWFTFRAFIITSCALEVLRLCAI